MACLRLRGAPECACASATRVWEPLSPASTTSTSTTTTTNSTSTGNLHTSPPTRLTHRLAAHLKGTRRLSATQPTPVALATSSLTHKLHTPTPSPITMKMDMKMEKMSQKALERKSNKPIMEKKRRARINHCLNQLKSLILETDNERSRHSKLEKADILEMTVRYLQTLRTYHLHLQQIQQIGQHQQQNSPQPHNQAHLLEQHFRAQHQQAAAAAAAQLQLQLQQSPLPLPLHIQHQHSPNHSQLSPTWRPW